MKISVKGIFSEKNRRLKKSKLFKVTAQNLSVLWLDAIQHFIAETARAMLVDTGMSVNSLAALARAADKYTNKVEGFVSAKERGTGQEAIDNRLNGRKRDFRIGYTGLNGIYYPKAIRSAETGDRLGLKAFKIELVESQSGSGQFQFRIVVYQHEKLMSVSILYGKYAMIDYIRSNLNKYVSMEKVFLDYLRS